MAERALIFAGRRWPAARAQTEPVLLAMTLADGTPLTPRAFVRLTTTGSGAAWIPEPVDGTWRDLATLNLADPAACQAFARRRGDPANRLSQGRPAGYVHDRPIRGSLPRARPVPAVPGEVVTSQWLQLAIALQQAALAWRPPDDDGISFFDPARKDEAKLFTKELAAKKALGEVHVDTDADGGLVDRADWLAGFLVFSAALAIGDERPMGRCQVCDSWFTIRRPGRFPRFCSRSCRATRPDVDQGEAE